MTIQMIVAISVGFICVGASFAAAFGNARVISTALESMARQPEIQGKLFTSMLIGVSLLEVVPIVSIVISFMLIPLIGK